MKNLIVYAHPNPKSFNRAILDTVKAAASGGGHEVEVRDLYALGFKPVLTGEDLSMIHSGKIPDDIAKEQQYIAWADVVTAVYPIWWTGLPAIFKGYIDRVLTFGFAYSFGEKGVERLLTGKKALLISTTGMPRSVYEPIKMYESLQKTQDAGIFEFCGFEVVAHKFLSGVTSIDDTARKAMLGEVSALVQGL